MVNSKIKVRKVESIDCYDFDLEIGLHNGGVVKKQFCLDEEETKRLMNNIKSCLEE